MLSFSSIFISSPAFSNIFDKFLVSIKRKTYLCCRIVDPLIRRGKNDPKRIFVKCISHSCFSA